MSKQSEAKAIQQYEPKPHTCGNCVSFRSKTEKIPYNSYPGSRTWTREYELRCAIGQFKIGKSGTCKEWQRAVPKPTGEST